MKQKEIKYKEKIEKIYNWFMKSYGPQGWWPVLDHKGEKPNITGDLRGYHPGDYSYPKISKSIFSLKVDTAW